MAIYLKLPAPPSSIRELLLRTFSYNHTLGELKSLKQFSKIPAVIKNGNFYSVSTFHNKECNLLQCKAGKMRSYDDIVELVATYFPNTTEKELVEAIVCTHPNLIFYTYNCPDIGKPTLGYKPKSDYYDVPKWSGEHLNRNSKYDWKSILNIIGVNNHQELIKYYDTNIKKI